MRTNLIKTKELPKVAESPATDGMLDMVIAFDTTGSMSAYINAVKTHVKELVPKLFGSNPDLRIGIVAFFQKNHITLLKRLVKIQSNSNIQRVENQLH